MNNNNLKRPVYCLIFNAIINLSFLSAYEADITQSERNLKNFEYYVFNEMGDPSDRETIQRLSGFLLSLGPNSTVVWDSELQTERAQTLSAIVLPIIYGHPEHATIPKEKITDSQRSVLEGEKAWSVYSRISGSAFLKLENMQTPESVSTLASFLEDTKGGSWDDQYPTQPKNTLRSNALMAATSLYRIGLKERPTTILGDVDPQNYPGYPQEMFVDPWKKWWQEIVEGRRTYSFIGDSRRFNSRGLVTQTPRISNLERPSNSAEDETFLTSGEKDFTWIWILLGVFTVGSLALLAKGIRAKG